MLHYFKKYLGNVGATAVASTSFGAICGGVIGVVGLYKVSSLDGYVNSMDPYKNITPEEMLSHQRYAAGIGASIGSLAGLSVGAIIYPAYTGFINLCRNRLVIDSEQQTQSIGDEIVSDSSASP
ncbi:MAG TPA: hypothetical protein PLF17_06150 [Chitinophagaceae bacterium]|nr:hypothetical protein [Chitinophagaceae bacterium]